jgi:hypothetical protein
MENKKIKVRIPKELAEAIKKKVADKKAKEEKDKKDKLEESEQLNELSPEAMEALQAIGGFAGLAGVAFGIVKAGVAQAKKELVAKFKAAGKEVPDPKTLDALATKAFKGAMDRATGAGSGASTPDVKI